MIWYMPLNMGYPGLKRIHEQPPIYVCHDFLSDDECAALMQARATPGGEGGSPVAWPELPACARPPGPARARRWPGWAARC